MNFQIEVTKKRLNLQTYQQLYSMTSLYLGKICVISSELLFLNVMKMLFYFIKLPMKDLFFSEQCPFCYLVIGGCPFFLQISI